MYVPYCYRLTVNNNIFVKIIISRKKHIGKNVFFKGFSYSSCTIYFLSRGHRRAKFCFYVKRQYDCTKVRVNLIAYKA